LVDAARSSIKELSDAKDKSAARSAKQSSFGAFVVYALFLLRAPPQSVAEVMSSALSDSKGEWLWLLATFDPRSIPIIWSVCCV
jgi:hypothetical protein